MRPNIPQLKLGNIQGYSPIFKTAYAWIFVLFLKAPRFPQTTLSENCLLLGTDMSADKYRSIFSRQREAIVYISLMTDSINSLSNIH